MCYLALALIVSLSACSKGTTDDEEAEDSSESAPAADTANVEGAPAPVENLPPAETGSSQPSPAPQDTAATEATTTPVAMTGEAATYAVQKNDTLMKIAFNLYGDIMQWKNLYEMNKDSLKDANALTPGTSLKYNKPASDPVIERNGDQYLIKKGDTLGSVAYDIYGKKSKWKKLWENNKTLIKDPNKIYAGFYLYYQISEEEKRELESLKGSSPIGSTLPAAGGGTTEPTPTPESVPPEQSATPPTEAVGGLQSLATPQGNNRKPAGQKK